MQGVRFPNPHGFAPQRHNFGGPRHQTFAGRPPGPGRPQFGGYTPPRGHFVQGHFPGHVPQSVGLSPTGAPVRAPAGHPGPGPYGTSNTSHRGHPAPYPAYRHPASPHWTTDPGHHSHTRGKRKHQSQVHFICKLNLRAEDKDGGHTLFPSRFCMTSPTISPFQCNDFKMDNIHLTNKK